MTQKERTVLQDDYSNTDFRFNKKDYAVVFEKGLTEKVVREISRLKKEPKWMLDFRLKALKAFWKKPLPDWGPDLKEIDFQDLFYYLRASKESKKDWKDVPSDVKKTFDRLGIPEAEKKFLAGVGTQLDSEVVYHNIRESLSKQGVVFLSMDDGLKKFPEIVKEFFGKIVPFNDNKFAALNSAVWSGGSFVYIPKGVKVDIPLQAYFRINSEQMGQFERTLIVVEECAQVHYVEGCTAPRFSTRSLHAAVVEVVAKKDSHVRYTTIQNWAHNIYNLVTKRAFAYKNATVEWLDGNLGSKVTMKYPAIFLMEEGAKGEMLSIAIAGKNQVQDAGAKMVHLAPNTTSIITSKSICKDGGRNSFRGLLKVSKKARNIKSNIRCDALLLDEKSRTDTYPFIEVDNPTATVGHEATVGKIGEEQLFYLMSRGLTKEQAMALIVLGFIQPFTKCLPMEYSVELNRLIEMEMENSVG